MNSKFLTLNQKDLIKGCIVAFATVVLTSLYNAIEAGTIEFTWAFFKPICLSGVGAMIAYLLKNLLTNESGQILKP